MGQRNANDEELNFLFNHGAIGSRAKNTVLLSLPLVCYAISKLPGRFHLVAKLQKLSKEPSYLAEVHGSINAAVVAGPHPVPGPGPLHPVTLPECTVDLKTFPKKYRLPLKLQSQDPLYSQMVEFKSWMTSPVQLDRNGGPVASRTVKNIDRNIHLFMGYLHWDHCLEEFTLHHYLDLHLYAQYIAFQLKKENSRVNLAQQISHAKKVIQFLKRRADPKLSVTISSCEVWLGRLGKQISTLLPNKVQDIGILEDEGAWLRADQVVAMFEKLRVGALAGMAVDGDGRDYALRVLHDACLSSSMFGMLPPVRLSCLRTLQGPGVTVCQNEDCQKSVHHLSCKGNRLEVVGGDMFMVLPHHKLQVRWQRAVIKIKLPRLLQELLALYLEKGHHRVSPGSPFVFSDSHGRPMLEGSSMTSWFYQLLRTLGSSALFPPNRYAPTSITPFCLGICGLQFV